MTTTATKEKAPAPKKAEPTPFWTLYRVRWDFIGRVCGQTPQDPDLIAKWLEARTPRVAPPDARSLQSIQDEVLESLAAGEGEASDEFSSLVFQKHLGVCCFRSGTIRAHMKDCARVLSGLTGKIEGVKAFSTRVLNGVYPDEHTYWIPLLRNEQPILEADGAFDKAVHVKYPRPTNALKRIQFIEPPSSMTFTLKVLLNCVTIEDLQSLFMYGGTHGYAGERSDGEGRYEFSIEHIGTQG